MFEDTFDSIEDDPIFDREILKSCADEAMFEYTLPEPLSKDFNEQLGDWGEIETQFASLAKLENEHFVLTSNLDSNKLRFRLKMTSDADEEELVLEFESKLKEYYED